MKKIFLLLPICIWLSACKKNKSEEPPPKPIADYPLDDWYIKNIISDNLHCSYTGNIEVTSDSFDVSAKAILLTGNGYMLVDDADALDFKGNQFTLAAWIKPSKTSVAYVIAKGDEGLNYTPYALDYHPGFVHAFIRTTTKEQFVITGTTPIVQYAWQHVAVTFTGDKLTIYYNGKSEGSVAVDRPLAANKGKLGIGGSPNFFPAGSMYGRIDNVKIYDKALTAAQINFLAKNYNY